MLSLIVDPGTRSPSGLGSSCAAVPSGAMFVIVVMVNVPPESTVLMMAALAEARARVPIAAARDMVVLLSWFIFIM